MPLLDVNQIIKPETKYVAHGSVDRVDVGVDSVLFGVSASTWKGSSGGPCVITEGPLTGAIIGLGKNLSYSNIDLDLKFF